MRKPIRKSLPAVLLSVLLLASSCVVADKLTLTDSALENPVAGKNHVDLTVDDFFVGVVTDLSSWEQVGNGDPIIDVAVNDFVLNLNQSSVTSSVRFINTGVNTYIGDFSFSDFGKLLCDISHMENQDLVTLCEKDGHSYFALDITMDNYGTLCQMIPFLADPNFEVWGPMYNHDMEEEDYLDLVSFILGEDGPDSIRNSSVRIQVVAPGQIIETNGEIQRNKKTVEFTMPLIDFLLLKNPIHFYCEY